MFGNMSIILLTQIHIMFVHFFGLMNKHFLKKKKIPVGSCAKSFIFFHYIRFFIHSELEVIFQFVMLHTGLLHFELQAM